MNDTNECHCARLAREMPEKEWSLWYSFVKAIGGETRLRILSILSHQSSCICNLAERLHVSQPTMTAHIKQLKENNLVRTIVDGREKKVENYPETTALLTLLQTIFRQLNSEKLASL
jgi:DNA-binding transcriptional ArsR family regulator